MAVDTALIFGCNDLSMGFFPSLIGFSLIKSQHFSLAILKKWYINTMGFQLNKENPDWSFFLNLSGYYLKSKWNYVPESLRREQQLSKTDKQRTKVKKSRVATGWSKILIQLKPTIHWKPTSWPSCYYIFSFAFALIFFKIIS